LECFAPDGQAVTRELLGSEPALHRLRSYQLGCHKALVHLLQCGEARERKV